MKKLISTIIGIIVFALAGTVYAVQVTVPSAPGAGYALISTSTGNYTAVATSTLGWGSFWSSLSNNIYNSNVGNVGIGTTTPGDALTVSGKSTAKNFSAYETFSTSTISGGLVVASSTRGRDNLNVNIVNGFVGIGLTDPVASLHIVFDENTAAEIARDIVVENNDTVGHSTHVTTRHSRGTHAAPTALNSSDYIGAFTTEAYNGSTWVRSGYIAWFDKSAGGNTSASEWTIRNKGAESAGITITPDTATSTVLVGVGTSTPTAKLAVTGITGRDLFALASSTDSRLLTVDQNGKITSLSDYAKFGSATPLQSCDTGTTGASCMEVWGDNNTTSGVLSGVGNRNSGTSAYAGMFLNNNLTDSSVTHFGFVGLNSSTYSDTTFGTGIANANQMFIQNTDGTLSLVASTSTSPGYINLFAGGTATTNEIMRVTSTGVGIGTTTPTKSLVVKANGTGSVIIGDDVTHTNYGAISLYGGLTGTNYTLLGAASATDRTLYINRASAGDIKFRENNADQVTIKSTTGAVGIGTTTPSTPLQVTVSASNATSTLTVGKALQNKGSCLELYDAAGTAIYASVAAGATTFTLSSTSCK